MLITDMRASDTVEVCASEVVRVSLLLHDHFARVLINLVMNVREAEEREGEEEAQVCVVVGDAGSVAFELYS